MTSAITDADALALIPSPDEMLGRTVHERVREALRAGIMSGTLRPGFRLRQSDLAVTLSVSVTPVREALRDLTNEGLVQIDPHRGAMVRSIDLDEFLEIRELLIALWTLCMRRVASQITDAEIAELEVLQARIEADPDAYLSLNDEFHLRIERFARAPRTAAMLDSLRHATGQVVRTAVSAQPLRVTEAIAEHREMLVALRARDADALVASMVDHVRPTWDMVEQLIRAGEPPASVSEESA